jgi:hypothetical protein
MNSPFVTAEASGTTKLFEKMVLYKRKFNAYTGDYEGAEHTTVSHYADAIRYMSDAILQFFNATTGTFLINTDSITSSIPAYLPDDQVNFDF